MSTTIIIVVLFVLIVGCLAGLAWAMIAINAGEKDYTDRPPPRNARKEEEEEQEDLED